MVSDPYEYDVAVSFAGAQRAYVEKFVEACRRRGLAVFYDRDMTVAYWGSNSIREFRRIYGGSAARFVMPFISAEYLDTPYPQDEFAAAVEQVLRRDGRTYLLPVVVGEVAIPPELLSPAIVWLRADDHTPAQLAEKTAQRVELAKSGAPGTGSRPGAGMPSGATRQPTVRRPRRTATALVAAGLAAATGLVWWILDYLSGNPSGDWRFVPIALTIAGVCGAAELIVRGNAGKLGALVVAGLGVVVTASGLVPSGAPNSAPSSAPNPGPSSAPSSAPSATPCARQATTAVVNPGPDSGAVDASLLEASYKVQAQRGGYVFLQMAGKVRGGPGPNQVLWLLGTADPSTHDSQRPPNDGSPQYHVVQQIKPNDAGCWTTTLRRLNYDCIGGLTFRYYLAILSPQQAQEMTAVDKAQDGFAPQNILDRQIPLLSSFDVPTKPNC
jgi:hypothetical protein